MTKNGTALRERMPWQERLGRIVSAIRDLSRHTNPQDMVAAYTARVRELVPTDGLVALSRRELPLGQYRITRSHLWGVTHVNPWKDRDRLPLLEGGLLGTLIYSDLPHIINDLRVDPTDPAHRFIEGFRSLVAMPHYDGGSAMNMVVLLRREPDGFDVEDFPEMVWQSGLFGKATHAAVLSEQVKRAYDELDRELKVVADIQRSLLPSHVPEIPGVDLAAYYHTSRHAGGDYYDFFPLPDGRWGILIADVSGHGTPAAVVMAVTHSIAHAFPGQPAPPSTLLNFLNRKLAGRQVAGALSFVTAFYGIYDPSNRTLTYACAGHNPPILRRPGENGFTALDKTQNFPMGILEDTVYEDHTHQLNPGDSIVFYTDGITEARGEGKAMFGDEGINAALDATPGDAQAVVDQIVGKVREFTRGAPAEDDRTLLVFRVK